MTVAAKAPDVVPAGVLRYWKDTAGDKLYVSVGTTSVGDWWLMAST